MRRLVFILSWALLLFGCQSRKTNTTLNIPADFDWQGHRGARGLLPENTIPAFLKALAYPVRTLELDLAVSKDSQLVLSHEPWMSAVICSKPDKTPLTEAAAASLAIWGMTYAEVAQYDCGSRGNPRFPDQQAMVVHKPLLQDMVAAVEAHCKANRLKPPFYNIEIKSRPEWDNHYTPTPESFAQLLIEALQALGIQERSCIQSFDVRALQAVHQMDSALVTALLVENTDNLAQNLERLGFVPTIYSPYHALVNAQLVKQTHDKGMRIIPWTVNDLPTMRSLIQLGVDGIITDYPNLIEKMGEKK